MTPELKQRIEQEAKSYASSFGYFPGSSEDEDMQSAYITGATRYTNGLQAAEEKIERYEKALKDIVRPIAYLQRKAEEEGGAINGHIAQELANSASFLQGIAREAITNKNSTNERQPE